MKNNLTCLFLLDFTQNTIVGFFMIMVVVITLYSCSDNEKTHVLNSKKHNQTTITTSPKVLWKTRISKGKINLLFSKGDTHYFYLETSHPSGKRLTITAINFNNGKKLYLKRDVKFPLGQTLLRENILYYSTINGFYGFNLVKGKGVLNFGQGYYLTFSKQNSNLQPIILLNAPSVKNKIFNLIISYDLNKHRLLWQKPYDNEMIFETKSHLFMIQKNNNLITLNKISGNRLSEVESIVNKLKRDTKIIFVDDNNLYLLIGSQFYNINYQNNKIIWHRDINNGYTKFLTSTEQAVLIQVDDFVYAFGKVNGNILWHKNYQGNLFKVLPSNLIIFNTLEKMFAVDINSGKLIWQINHPEVRNYPIIQKKQYFYFQDRGNGQYLLKKINISNKPREIHFKLNDNGTDHYSRDSLNLNVIHNLLLLGSVSSKIFHNNQIADSTLSLKAYDLRSGIEKWRYAGIKAGYLTKALQIDHAVIVASNKGMITSLDIQTGKVNWQLQTKTFVSHYSGTLSLKILKKTGSIIYLYYNDAIYAIDTAMLTDNPTNVKEI